MRIGIAFLLIASAAACAPATQHPVPVSGSKADATVTLAAEYSEHGTQPNWSNAVSEATARCGAWGYTGAEPLGSKFTTCVRSGAYGICSRYRETITYQCLGGTTTSVQ
ncbi:YecR family lipoprotein [Albimonas pacifica]|uniref:YecR family lipoprotein n=1 Tax=Albimonas pacifica TaxID=1114924 RepID=UPI0011607E0B